jgi:hypothetical protein
MSIATELLPSPAPRHKARRNPYRPGTRSYAAFRQSELNRRRALAEATAARAKNSGARLQAQLRAASARRGIRAIETRRVFRELLSDRDRSVFDALPINEQDRFRAAVQRFPEHVPPSDPDPFGGRPSYRGSLWRLYYSTRGGIRRRAAA